MHLYATGANCTSQECPLNTGTHLWSAPIADLYACIAEVHKRVDAIGKTMHSLKSWEAEEANRLDDCEEQIHTIRMNIGLLPKDAATEPALPATEPALPSSVEKEEKEEKKGEKDEVIADSEEDAENPLKKRKLEEAAIGNILDESLPLDLLG